MRAGTFALRTGERLLEHAHRGCVPLALKQMASALNIPSQSLSIYCIVNCMKDLVVIIYKVQGELKKVVVARAHAIKFNFASL